MMQAQVPAGASAASQMAAASRVPSGPQPPSAPQPPTPGALPAGQFRTEGGAPVPARTFWQSMGTTVMGRLVPLSRDGSQQSQASVWVGGPNGIEVLEWWRSVTPSSAILEIDGVPMLNLPCRPGRGGPHLQCYDGSGDVAAIERTRAAMRSGHVLRVVFMSGAAPQSEASFSLTGFRA
jgi:hypothetical protein